MRRAVGSFPLARRTVCVWMVGLAGAGYVVVGVREAIDKSKHGQVRFNADEFGVWQPYSEVLGVYVRVEPWHKAAYRTSPIAPWL